MYQYIGAIKKSIKAISHFINGKHVTGTSGRHSDVFNPVTGEVSAHLCNATTAEKITAIDAAQAAFTAWSATPALRRAAHALCLNSRRY